MRRENSAASKGANVYWQFTKRPDDRIAITLDNNVWDFFFRNNTDLAVELPQDRFALFITREVEIETSAIPNEEAKALLKQYIAHTIEACGIETTWVFGFAHEGPGPERYGGFDVGVWQSNTEQEYYEAIRQRFLEGKGMRKSELLHNEGDAAVGAQSFFSVALTCEKPTKQGPLRFARENGGAVLYLPDMIQNGQTLRAYIESYYSML